MRSKIDVSKIKATCNLERREYIVPYKFDTVGFIFAINSHDVRNIEAWTSLYKYI